jgi:transposase
MDWTDFLIEMLGITKDFGIVEIEKIEKPKKIIRIHLKYLENRYKTGASSFPIYDKGEEREWQHLSWFDYKCYLVCNLPRYKNEEGKVKTIEPNFAPKGKSYTHLFCKKAIELLQQIRVQQTVATLMNTSAHIIRSIMENYVEQQLALRKAVKNLTHISIDEKAFGKGHDYATILIDSNKEYVVELCEGRKEEHVKALIYNVTGEETLPQLKRVNMDMWVPYMNTFKALSPQALIVHDKFHLIQKLSEAIDKTRKQEVKTSDLLLKQKYTVLKNESTRNKAQQEAFELIDNANLKTAQAWHVRENFKRIFQPFLKPNCDLLLNEWIAKTRAKGLQFVNYVVKTFERHKEGIINAMKTQSDSSMHENMNGKIQAVLAKAKGFINFERFRINILFYFGNLNFKPQYF